MSETVQIALIAGLTTMLPVMLQLWLSQRATRAQIATVKEEVVTKIDDVKVEVEVVKANVTTIEKHTNGMQAALMQATEKEALGRGLAAGKIEGAAEEKANPTA